MLTSFTVIVLQMFIAVINENFNVAEESKKDQQATNYWATHRPQHAKVPWLRQLNPYRWVKADPVKVKVENLPPNLVLPMQKALVQDYNIPRSDKHSLGVCPTYTVVMDSTYNNHRRMGPHQAAKVVTILRGLLAPSSSSLLAKRNLTMYP